MALPHSSRVASWPLIHLYVIQPRPSLVSLVCEVIRLQGSHKSGYQLTLYIHCNKRENEAEGVRQGKIHSDYKSIKHGDCRHDYPSTQRILLTQRPYYHYHQRLARTPTGNPHKNRETPSRFILGFLPAFCSSSQIRKSWSTIITLSILVCLRWPSISAGGRLP